MTDIFLKTPLSKKLSDKLEKKIISNTWVGILKIFSHSSPSAISSILSKKVCHHQQNQFVYDLMDEKKVYVRKKSDWKCKNHIQFSLFLCSLLMWWQWHSEVKMYWINVKKNDLSYFLPTTYV